MRPLSPRTLYRFSCSSWLSAPPFSFQISHLSTSSSSHHTHSHSSFRRHDEDVRNVRVSVWWDFENCHLPAGVNVFKVTHAITAAIRANGIKGPIQITAFGDMLQLSRSNQEALSSTGINLTHVPHGGKNSADRSLLVDLMYWVSQNPPPAHLFLISGDRDFASTLHRLRMNNYNILLASPENTPGVLCSAASIMWPWNALLTGENLNGRYFNQPPDGPYGSWYGHYKVALEDPYSVIDQLASSQSEKLSDAAGSDVKSRPIPVAVIKKIRQILKSYPKGISISDLRMELGKYDSSIDRDFYGYKKFSRFLSSIPHILKLQPLGEGKFLIHAGCQKSSQSSDGNVAMWAKPVTHNGGKDLNLASELDCEDSPMNLSANRKFSVPTSHEPNVAVPYRELEQPVSLNSSLNGASGGNPVLPPSPKQVKSSSTIEKQISAPDEKPLSPLSTENENMTASVPIDEKVVEVTKPQDTELHYPLAAPQDSVSEESYFKSIWRKWFGRRESVSGTRSHSGQEELSTSGNGIEKEGQNAPAKHLTSVDNSGKQEDNKKFVASTSQVVDQAPPAPSSSPDNESARDTKAVTKNDVYTNEPKTSPGLFDQIVYWYKFWRRSPSSDKLSDQSYGRLKMTNTYSDKQKLFSTDLFWADMESFMATPKGSILIFESRTREQMAINLQKEGPSFLRSLSKGDLLHLIDLLISEKKWVEECLSQTVPFRPSHHDEKSSLDHSNGSNRLRSIFLSKPSRSDRQGTQQHDGEEKCRNIPHSGVSLPAMRKKPSNRSRSEIITNCQKLVNGILKEYPEGYNMGLFRKLFLDRYGYHLDLPMLGYKKLAYLLQAMPGVKVESSYILPCIAPEAFDEETSVPSIQKHTGNHTVANSDSELSDAAGKDDGSDSQWEELGPVAVANTSNKNEVEAASRRKALGSTGFDYEPSLSDDFSDSDGEMSPITESEGQSASRVNKEDSSLLQILDSWYSDKDGESSKDKSGNVDEMVDSPSVSKVHGSSGVGTMSGASGNTMQTKRPQKSYSFVADSVGDNKERLIGGILDSLKKPSEPWMQS